MRQLTACEKKNRERAIRYEKAYKEKLKVRSMIAEYIAKLRDIMQEADNSDYVENVLTRWSVKIEAKYLRENRFDVLNYQIQNLEKRAGRLTDEQICFISRQLQRLGFKVKENGQPDSSALGKKDLWIHMYDDGSVEVEPIIISNPYNFPIDGNCVESTTFVGNTHVWRSDGIIEIEDVKPDHIVEDEPKKINFREFL